MGKDQKQVKFRKSDAVGTSGEDMAAGYLKDHGFKILGRNVRYKTGEIDIVAAREKELHFFEVKSRTDPSLVSPVEAITERKKGRVKAAARMYLSDTRNNFNYNDLPPCYFSVISIDFTGEGAELECILDAFY